MKDANWRGSFEEFVEGEDARRLHAERAQQVQNLPPEYIEFVLSAAAAGVRNKLEELQRIIDQAYECSDPVEVKNILAGATTLDRGEES